MLGLSVLMKQNGIFFLAFGLGATVWIEMEQKPKSRGGDCPHLRPGCGFERDPFHVHDRRTAGSGRISELLVLDIPICEGVRLSCACLRSNLCPRGATVEHHTS